MLLKRITNIALATTSAALVYLFFFTHPSWPDVDPLVRVRYALGFLLPFGLVGFVIHHTRYLAPIVISWCVVFVNIYIASQAWICGKCEGFMYLIMICFFLTWLGAIVAALFTSRKRL